MLCIMYYDQYLQIITNYTREGIKYEKKTLSKIQYCYKNDIFFRLFCFSSSQLDIDNRKCF